MNPKTQLALWIAHPILELALGSILVWRGLHRKFPVFFAYIVSQILIFAVLFPIYLHQDLAAGYSRYFWAYWIGAAISLAIGFKVIHEIFVDVFRPFHTLKDLGTVLFKWSALVMLLMALVVAAASPASHSPLTQAIIMSQRCVRVIQCGLILFLIVFSRYLGVSWRQPSFGIALGFGGYASIELAGVALYSGGQLHPDTLGLLQTTAYGFAILSWIGYALLNVVPKETSSRMLMSQRWDQTLTDLQHPVPADSLIPMFEGMVDRAFSRTPNVRETEEISAGKLTRRMAASQERAPALSVVPAKR